jgi:uncharacterized membrane protein YhfC
MNILYIFYPINFLGMVILPIALGIYLTRRFKFGWRIWWIGAATFILSQVVHIPLNQGINQLFLSKIIPTPTGTAATLLFSLIGGLTAGVCEEGARYLVLRFWAKDARSWRKGVLFGAGHGGMEAILLGFLAFWGFIQLAGLQGVADLTKVVPADQVAALQATMQQYWSAPWYSALLGMLERAFTLPVQMALAVMVMQVFTRRQIRWLWLAIAWHTLIDMVIAGLAVRAWMSYPWGAYAIEGLVLASALLSLAILFGLRQPEPVEAAPLDAPLAPLQVSVVETIDDEDKLSDSKFSGD